MSSEPQKFLCPSCLNPLDVPGKASDIRYREVDHSIVIRLACSCCEGAVFLAVPLGDKFAVRVAGHEFRSNEGNSEED